LQTNSIGVFARNHLQYLQYATRIGKASSTRLVTFRSSKRWAGAAKGLARVADMPIYFGSIGDEPRITHRARLRQILLGPEPSETATKRLLEFAPPATKDEGLWDGSVSTLYAISGCYKVATPFSISRLIKLSDGKPIDETFGYSYSVVQSLDPEIDMRATAVDLEEPPPRTEALVSRAIRDTRLVQRLKHLHDHRCQRCGLRLELGNGNAYSEGHHLKPLGAAHAGPDRAANILVLCPNCHAILDLCAAPIVYEQLHVHPDHVVGRSFVAYHNSMCGETA
jgi:HNH endonuclease